MKYWAFTFTTISMLNCGGNDSENGSSSSTTESSSSTSSGSEETESSSISSSTSGSGGASAQSSTSTTNESGGFGGIGGGDTGGGSDVPLDGFGTISGDCGVLDPSEIDSTAPYYFENVIDFGDEAYSYDVLSEGGKEIYDDGNLGGSSLESEIISYEVLYRCELAQLLKTESEVEYEDDGGKKTDLLVSVDSEKLGVSVTRAYAYPEGTDYTLETATELLEKKLGDILLSTENVSDTDAWKKQALHVIAYNEQHAEVLHQAYDLLDASLQADTLMIVTVSNGDDAFIY